MGALIEARHVCNLREIIDATANQEAMYSVWERKKALVDAVENLSSQQDLLHLSWSCFPGSGDRQTIKVTFLPACSHQPTIQWRHLTAHHTLCPSYIHYCNNKNSFHNIYSKFWISLYDHLRCFACFLFFVKSELMCKMFYVNDLQLNLMWQLFSAHHSCVLSLPREEHTLLRL